MSDDLTASESPLEPAPSATAPSLPRPAKLRWPRVLAWTAAIGLLLVVLLVGALAGGLWWAVRSEAGSNINKIESTFLK